MKRVLPAVLLVFLVLLGAGWLLYGGNVVKLFAPVTDVFPDAGGGDDGGSY